MGIALSFKYSLVWSTFRNKQCHSSEPKPQTRHIFELSLEPQTRHSIKDLTQLYSSYKANFFNGFFVIGHQSLPLLPKPKLQFTWSIRWLGQSVQHYPPAGECIETRTRSVDPRDQYQTTKNFGFATA